MLLDINMSKLVKLIESFYTLTKIKITVYDDSFNEILAYPASHSTFCHMMNENPEIHAKCNASAKALCELCRKEDRLVMCTCHAGLTEVCAPLHENGLTIGYIMFGQITNIKKKAHFAQNAASLCKNYSLDRDEFTDKINTVPYKSNEQIEAVSQIINTFTSYIYLERIISLKKEEALASIIDYIKNNLGSDLSVRTICERFSVSKTFLYELTKPVMPDGIAKYIRAKRIEKAQLLISETDKSIEEISGLVGFLDCNYFRRLFKQICGMSANAYRKKHKNRSS